jgi:protein gp37
MSETSIEWTDATWNPVAGCSVVSAGCTNCYAMRMAARLSAMGVEKYHGLTRKSGKRTVWRGKVFIDEGAVHTPLSWKRPRKIFVNSMSDLFHEDVPERFIRTIWKTMAAAHWHTFQILTKRPERMAQILSNESRYKKLANVWLGTSIEDSNVIARADKLRTVPAVVRFVSFEPLIGSVANVDLSGVDWAIVGGESGPSARPMLTDWVDEIFHACQESGTAFFFKQWGGKNKKIAGRSYLGRTWDDLPELRI